MMTEDRVGTLKKLSDATRMVADPTQDVRGRKVFDRSGADLGKIDDLLIDSEGGGVQFLRVEHGGILGIGTMASFIPVEAITRVTDDAVYIDPTREKVADAPRYDPDLIDQEDYYNDVYGHYGYTPYSVPGYVYPRWPFLR